MAQSPAKAEMIEELMGLARVAIAGELAGQVTTGQAETLAERMVMGFLETWGGVAVYVPRPDALRRMTRNRAIAREFRGGDVDAIRLARQHNLSTPAIYRIAKAEIARQRLERVV